MFQRVRVPLLESERLVLRGWNKNDTEDLYEYAKDPLVGPAAGWPPHRSRAESEFIIGEVYMRRLSWAIVVKDEGRPVGNIGLDEDVLRKDINSRELGYSISSGYWGEGIATEAVRLVTRYCFEVLGLDSLTVRAELDNLASRKVALKNGFVFEGILRRAYRRYDNMIVDMACYSMLNSDYYYGENNG